MRRGIAVGTAVLVQAASLAVGLAPHPTPLPDVQVATQRGLSTPMALMMQGVPSEKALAGEPQECHWDDADELWKTPDGEWCGTDGQEPTQDAGCSHAHAPKHPDQDSKVVILVGKCHKKDS